MAHRMKDISCAAGSEKEAFGEILCERLKMEFETDGYA